MDFFAAAPANQPPVLEGDITVDSSSTKIADYDATPAHIPSGFDNTCFRFLHIEIFIEQREISRASIPTFLCAVMPKFKSGTSTLSCS
jgi:hypothetical protein